MVLTPRPVQTRAQATTATSAAAASTNVMEAALWLRRSASPSSRPYPSRPCWPLAMASRSRGSSEARRSGGSGEDSGSARTSSSGGRRHVPAPSSGNLQAPPLPSGNPPTPPNASPMQMALKLREQDSSPARLVPFQGFSTSVPLTPSAFSQYASRRSPAPPPLPMDLLLSATPQPAFDAMLMAPLPSDLHKTDVSKVIVVLETSTGSQKTTLQTLIARPSHLASHIVGLYHSTAMRCPCRLLPSR